MRDQDPDLAFTLCCAARYALGRRTYAVAIVADTVRRDLGVFPEYDLRALAALGAVWAERKEEASRADR